MIGDHTILTLPRDAGRHQADLERERLEQRHAWESAFLYEKVLFEWSPVVDGGRFEELAKSLLELEPGASWVRFAGSPFEADQGRDLLLDLATPLLATEADPSDQTNAHRVRRVVVQCKSDATRVGVSRVTGIGDAIEYHGSTGYLLVVRSGPTAALIERLDRLRAAGSRWIDWWTRDDLENRLRRHPHLLERFSDIVWAAEAEAEQ
jgi:hypothetical protein